MESKEALDTIIHCSDLNIANAPLGFKEELDAIEKDLKEGKIKRFAGLRMTKQNESDIYSTTDYYELLFNPGAVLSKLGQLEDIEDELGIDLITLFKALRDGIYGKVGDKIEHILAPHFSFYYEEIYIFKIKDYGKTWALTKEELEND